MSSVTINGFRMALNGENADTGTGLWCNKVAGWADFAADRQSDPRVDQHGSFAADQGFASGATPSLEGICAMPSGAAAARMKMKLRAIAGYGKEVDVVLDDNGFVTQRRCTVANISTPHNHGRPGFTWAIDMTSDDPYAYGAEVADSTGLPQSGGGMVFPAVFPTDFGTPGDLGRLTVRNAGFAPSFSRFAITGGFDSAGFTIIRLKTGERITLARQVPIGSTVYIDPRTGRVSIDGTDNDISGFLTQYDWWETDPESEEQLQFVANGTASGTPKLFAYTKPAY